MSASSAGPARVGQRGAQPCRHVLERMTHRERERVRPHCLLELVERHLQLPHPVQQRRPARSARTRRRTRACWASATTSRKSFSAASASPLSSSALRSFARRASSFVPVSMSDLRARLSSRRSQRASGRAAHWARRTRPHGGRRVDESRRDRGSRPAARICAHATRSARHVTSPVTTDGRRLLTSSCVQCLDDLLLGRRVIVASFRAQGSSGAGELRRGLMPEPLARCQTAAEVLGTARHCAKVSAPRTGE